MVAKNSNSERADRNHQSHFARANLYVGLANQTEQGLSNTLFLVATIFLGITSPLVSNIQSLAEGLKAVMFISWVFTITSIVAGLVQILVNLNFFAKAFKLSNEQEGIWANMPDDKKEYDRMVELSDKKVEETELQSSLIPLGVQTCCMVVAILLAMVVGGFALFTDDSNPKTRSLNDCETIIPGRRMKQIRTIESCTPATLRY